MPDIRIGYRPFDEQVAYFRRKLNMPSARWDDLRHGEHAHGFMAAGVARADVLDELRQAVHKAIADGEGFDAFKSRFDDIIAKHGWIGGAGDESAARRAWRARVIYQTNLRTSYMAGRWETLKAFPYLRYQHNTVTNPREQHLAWDGLVLRRDDPWWDTHYPPNGWGCRCSVTGVGKGRMAALGKDGPDPAPGPGPGDPPPEWAYHPGKAAKSLAAAESFGRKVMALPPAWRKIALDDARKRSVNWLQPAWQDIVTALDTQSRAAAPMRAMQRRGAPAAFLRNDVVAALESGEGRSIARREQARSFAPVTPESALLVAGDEFLAHSIRDLSPNPAARQAIKQALLDVPARLVADDTRWLLDAIDGKTLIAAWPDDAGGFWKLIVGRGTAYMNRTKQRGYQLTTLERRTREQLLSYIALVGDL